MEQLTGLDARFLYSETPTAPMHTLKIAIMDVAETVGGLTHEGFLSTLAERIGRLPQLRERVVSIPLGLGHPVWVEDPAFDIERHVHFRTSPAPGGARELAAVVGEVAARRLPRDRPLWDVTVVDGLERGHVACIAKVHHAVADGMATVGMLQRALAEQASVPTPIDEPLPSRRELLRIAARGHRATARALPDLTRRSVRGLVAAGRNRRGPVAAAKPFDAPRSPLNVSLDATRTFAMTTLPLGDLLAVRSHFGTTLNDVYLAVCGGALRRYLAGRGDLPVDPLVAAVPLATPREASERRGHNHVDNMFVPLGTHIADPAARLRAIHEVVIAARHERALLGPELFEDRAALTPPQLYSVGVRLWTRTGFANHLRPPVNLVASNVPGPREPLHLAGARLDAIYSVGPILEGVGLNLTAWSYVDRIHVAALGCRRSLPDPWLLVDQLPESLAELVAATGVET
ncbi:MAG: WS/DGAT/MGAT family O-acyltransferase [Acidimicrobiia bacterium]